MSGVFQNIDPHPLTARRVCTLPALCGGMTHSLGGEVVGGHYFGRRQTQLCTLHVCKYSVLHPFSLLNQDVDGTSNVPFTCLLSNFAQTLAAGERVRGTRVVTESP